MCFSVVTQADLFRWRLRLDQYCVEYLTLTAPLIKFPLNSGNNRNKFLALSLSQWSSKDASFPLEERSPTSAALIVREISPSNFEFNVLFAITMISAEIVLPQVSVDIPTRIHMTTESWIVSTSQFFAKTGLRLKNFLCLKVNCHRLCQFFLVEKAKSDYYPPLRS